MPRARSRVSQFSGQAQESTLRQAAFLLVRSPFIYTDIHPSINLFPLFPTNHQEVVLQRILTVVKASPKLVMMRFKRLGRRCGVVRTYEEALLAVVGVILGCRGYVGIMERKMETTM